LIGALSPFNVFFLWVPVSESELLTVVHLLRDEGNILALDHFPLDSDITKLGGVEVALTMMRESRVNVILIHLWSSPSSFFE
jgi:hypothetical protein